MGRANEIVKEMEGITDKLSDFERKFAEQSQDLDRNDKSAVRDEITSMRKSIRGVEREIGGYQRSDRSQWNRQDQGTNNGQQRNPEREQAGRDQRQDRDRS